MLNTLPASVEESEWVEEEEEEEEEEVDEEECSRAVSVFLVA